MGIITNVKGFMHKTAKSAIDGANNAVDKASQFSSNQLLEIEDRRRKYLDQIPDMSEEAIQSAVQNNLGAMAIEVYQDYLNKLGVVYEPVDLLPEKYRADRRIMYFDITKWVTDSEEKSLDKLVNVYHVLSEEDCNIALIYNRTPDGCKISIGIVNTSDKSEPSIIQGLHKRVVEAIRGNFPGVDLRLNQGSKDSFGIGIPEVLKSVTNQKEDELHNSVAVVTNLPSEKSEDFISQSLEKLLDGIIPSTEEESYSIVLLAKPILEQLEKQNRLYELYSGLSPYASWSTNFMYTESMATNAGATLGVNVGASAGVQYSLATTEGKTTPERYKEDELKDASKLHMTKNQVKGAFSRLAGWYAPSTKNTSTTETDGVNAGVNFGVSFSRTSSVTAQLGKNEGLTQTYTNYAVKHTLDIIENQVKRMEQSAALGMWDFAAYVISKDPVVANNVAHMYVSLTQGEESFVSRSSISLWDGSQKEKRSDADTILKSVCLLQHPLFGMKKDVDKEWLMYPTLVTPTTSLSGVELAKALNFPRKSITKFPVLESVSFGRDVQTFNDDIDENTETRKIPVGAVYHMRRKEAGNLVNFDVDSLASHTFVTGSTGTGKSNIIYQLLLQLKQQDVNFLVVEPAKGEYKNIFGGYDDVLVYGTNPNITELLRINPFSFPESIHVLEHIDRLVEILNACWPMYAAMPAVLKDAIERIYINCGWNLGSSYSRTRAFPTFSDLLEELPNVMNQSMYSDDTKSDYSGALVTRVNSLTNGINKQIFCSPNEIEAEKLFKNNVIVDLSRIGAVETKSLIMGILIMKLQEYRLDLQKMNEPLLHVTVLEEAHNILRKTSIEQSQEGSNVQGKSVEMISNAIAEMRSFGEGFIIVDQAPNMLDESVIRNTNTKIVLRLPDSADRKTVGEAISLSDEQIAELAKLPKGVAAVYQNDWIQSVLCAFEKIEDSKMKPLSFVPVNNDDVVSKFLDIVFGNSGERLAKEETEAVISWIESQSLSGRTKNVAIGLAEGKDILDSDVEVLAYNLFGGKNVALILSESVDKREIGKENALNAISSMYDVTIATSTVENIYNMILGAIVRRNSESELCKAYGPLKIERGHM